MSAIGFVGIAAFMVLAGLIVVLWAEFLDEYETMEDE